MKHRGTRGREEEQRGRWWEQRGAQDEERSNERVKVLAEAAAEANAVSEAKGGN